MILLEDSISFFKVFAVVENSYAEETEIQGKQTKKKA